MAADPTIGALTRAPIVRVDRASRLYRSVSDYWILTKPEVNFLILITTFAGFYLAISSGSSGFRILSVVPVLVGTLLVASGAGTLNQFLECSFDAQMRRTARRPLASGRLKSSHVLWFGICCSIIGTLYLALMANVLASLLALITLLSYLFLYTPLKRKTPLCTLVGAFPGAVPPLIGWVAASGRLSPEAWALCAIVFFWQFPHFMAIAWMYRQDYARAGYVVLPFGELRNRFLVWQAFGASLILIPLSVIPTIIGKSSLVYSIGVLMLGSVFLYYSGAFVFSRSNAAARRLLVASIVYLPAIFFLAVFSKR